MNRVLWLASIAACLLIGGCAEPAGNPTTTTASEAAAKPFAAPDANGEFDYYADADFQSLLDSNTVVVVNFTADW